MITLWMEKMATKGVSDRVVAEGQKEDESTGLQQQIKEERDWSKLPSDVVGYIVGKLYWSDRIQIRAVCKSWHQVPLEWIPTIDKAAWVMIYGKGVKAEFKLRDTSLGKVVYTAKGIKAEEQAAIFDNAEFESSRYGWALFKKYPCYGVCQRYTFFLYSPFTDEIIELPTLDLGYSICGRLLKATFYLSSANSECLIFSVHMHYETLSISTCQPVDESWKTYNFLESQWDWDGYPLSATYLGGCFYCLFTAGALGVFNVGRQEWKLLVKSWTDSAGPDEYYFFGELVAIPRSPCSPLKRRRVMKFDFPANR